MLREREREPERQKHISQTFADLTENFIDSGIKYTRKKPKKIACFLQESKRDRARCVWGSIKTARNGDTKKFH